MKATTATPWWLRPLPNWLWGTARFLAEMMQRLGRDVNDENNAALTKEDGKAILAAIKDLRDYVSEPMVMMTAGEPEDKELK